MNAVVRSKLPGGTKRKNAPNLPGDYGQDDVQAKVVACTLAKNAARSKALGALPGHAVRAVFDSLDDALFVFDADERLLAVNASGGVYARADSKLNGWPDVLNLAATDRDALQRAWHTLQHQDEVLVECNLHRHGRSEIIAAQVRLRNISVRGDTLRLVTLRDISEIKSRENHLRRMASIDDLTQVANRRHFMATLNQEIGRARRYGHPVALLMVDVDHFKSINDQFGHDAGDRALRLLARVATKICRGADVVGRVGGEEFAILLPETRIEKALRVAERLRLTVAETPLMIGTKSVYMTVSIGVSAACGAACDSHQLLQRADAALYAAKHQGRNRVLADAQATGAALRDCLQNLLRSGSDRR